MEFIDWYGVSDSTDLMKPKGKSTSSRNILDQVEEKIAHADANAIQGGVAKNIIEGIEVFADKLPVSKCRGMSASEQARGVQHPASADPGSAASGVQDSNLPLALKIKRNYHTMMTGAVLVVAWMLTDVLAKSNGEKIAAGDHKAVMDLAMRIFLESIEMGNMARRFPRAIFAIGADAKTWKVDATCNFSAVAARIGVILTRRNVVSGAQDHASITGWRRVDEWRYMKSDNYDAAKATTKWLVRDSKYVLVISSGTRNYPRNYAHTGVGVGLCAADAQGVRAMSSDAHGLGPKGATDVSPPRWGPAHGRVEAPKPWSFSYNPNVIGQTMDAPVDVPWSLVPAMACNPESIVLTYVEPAFYDPQPAWLTNVGMEEMLRKSTSAGANVVMVGMDNTSQIVDPSQRACYLANQTWDFGWMARAMATIKLIQEQSTLHMVWPQLAAVHIDDAVNSNVAHTARASTAEGSSIFPDDELPDPGGDVTIRTNLRMSVGNVLDEDSEEHFLTTSYMEKLMDSDNFGKERRKNLWNNERPEVNYEDAPRIHPRETLLTIRAWLNCYNALVDPCLWRKTRLEGEWFRIPWRAGVSTEQHVEDGRERRFVPTSRQVLPGMARHGSILESRPGWTDNYVTRPKGPVMVPDVRAFTQLMKEHNRAGSCSDFLGDGCVCYLVLEVQVLPLGTSTDQLEHSCGNIFYHEAVQITLVGAPHANHHDGYGALLRKQGQQGRCHARKPVGVEVHTQSCTASPAPCQTAQVSNSEQSHRDHRRSDERIQNHGHGSATALRHLGRAARSSRIRWWSSRLYWRRRRRLCDARHGRTREWGSTPCWNRRRYDYRGSKP
jgi:hypothetical protein